VQQSCFEPYRARRLGPIGPKFLQLLPGIVEGVAQGKVYIPMSCTIDMETVGMDLRARHDQVNLDQIGCPGVAAGIRALERHMTLRDPPVISLQPSPQFPRAILEGA